MSSKLNTLSMGVFLVFNRVLKDVFINSNFTVSIMSNDKYRDRRILDYTFRMIHKNRIMVQLNIKGEKM